MALHDFSYANLKSEEIASFIGRGFLKWLY